MRRSAGTTLVLLTLIAGLGCEEPQQQEDLQEPAAQTAMMQPDLYASDPAAATTTGSESYTEYPAHQPAASNTTYQEPAPASNSVHVVAKGDTLIRLARKYYNDQSRWKEIYEANRGTMSHPDVLRIGQELVIP
ncbi:MAG: LysM peptidoglycan-binding domain-containing protein [bacterium]|nr:LysM peptidoglycan-binding domain-containing protein [bacterium]